MNLITVGFILSSNLRKALLADWNSELPSSCFLYGKMNITNKI